MIFPEWEERVQERNRVCAPALLILHIWLGRCSMRQTDALFLLTL